MGKAGFREGWKAQALTLWEMEVTHPEGILEVPGSSAVLDVFRAEGRKSWGGGNTGMIQIS